MNISSFPLSSFSEGDFVSDADFDFLNFDKELEEKESDIKLSKENNSSFKKVKKTFSDHKKKPYSSSSSSSSSIENENPLSPLSQKSKKLGTPSKLTASKLQKRHLTKALKSKMLSSSPIKGASKTNQAYGNCRFSLLAIEYRKEYKITAGRNVAIIEYDDDKDGKTKLIYASTSGLPGGAHAELIAYDKLPDHIRANPEKIRTVYSERKPCTIGSNCNAKLKLVIAKTTEVMWSIDFPENIEERQKIEAEFQEAQVKLGIGASSRGKTLMNKFKALNEDDDD